MVSPKKKRWLARVSATERLLREEVCGVHFYTLMVMRHALLEGAKFAARWSEEQRTTQYRQTAEQIGERLQSFWSDRAHHIVVTQEQCGGVQKPSGLDVSVILAAKQAANDDRQVSFYAPWSDEVKNTSGKSTTL